MFIRSVRSSTLKFTATLVLGVVLVTVLVIVLPKAEAPLPASSGEVFRYDGIGEYADMAEFLAQFGVTAAEKPFSDREVMLPADFEGVFAGYNELQKSQGLDLAPFAGKKLRKVVLPVPDYGGQAALATLFIYRNTVVGGDLSSEDPTGFVCTFDGQKNS